MAITDPSLLPSDDPVEVVVCGGGPTGTAAALAAARSGLSTLLVESGSQCGGMGTSGGVSHLLGGRTNDNRAWCVAGIFKELVDELAARGDAVHPETIDIPASQRYSPHRTQAVVSLVEAGVAAGAQAGAALRAQLAATASATDLAAARDELRRLAAEHAQALHEQLRAELRAQLQSAMDTASSLAAGVTVQIRDLMSVRRADAQAHTTVHARVSDRLWSSRAIDQFLCTGISEFIA